MEVDQHEGFDTPSRLHPAQEYTMLMMMMIC